MNKFNLTSAVCIVLMSILLLPFMIQAQENVHKTSMNCNLGKEYKIELQSTPSEGYVWTIGSPYDTTLIVLKNKTFVAGSDTTLPGKPGTDVFTFKAMGKGKATVRLILKKQYSRKVERAEDYEFIITK